MASDLTVAGPVRALTVARAQAVARPAELVELSERLYRAIFGAGLYVAVITALYGFGLVFVQVGDFPRAAAAATCALLAVALLAAARGHRHVYRALRRAAGVWAPLLGVLLACLHVIIGAGSQLLFPVTLLLVGLLGCAVPMRWVLLAGLIAGAGQAAAVFTHSLSANDQRALLTSAAADVFIPVIFTALVTYLARFMLELHRTVMAVPGAGAGPAPARRLRSSTRPPDASPTGEAASDPAPVRATRSVTARQLQVIALASEGLKHADIADCLAITPGQVGRLLKHARDRLGVATNQQLVAWAINEGLLPGS